MREFCIGEPPRAIFDADFLLHALAVVPDPADIDEEETMQPSYTENWGTVNDK